jgi:hypothetical protein
VGRRVERDLFWSEEDSIGDERVEEFGGEDVWISGEEFAALALQMNEYIFYVVWTLIQMRERCDPLVL